MNNNVLISIIIPLYNAMPFCKKLMESIYEQQPSEILDEIEVVVIDDGSADDGGQYMDELSKEHENLTVVHQENSGNPSIPRNRGIELARGKYIFFADADDRFYPGAIAKMLEYIKTHDIDVGVFEVDASSWGQDYRGLFDQSQEHCTFFNSKIIESLGPYKLFKRELINRHHIRFPEEGYYEDLPFAMESFFYADEISIIAGEPYYCYVKREDKKNLSQIPKTMERKIKGLLYLFETCHKLTTPAEYPMLFVKSIKYVFKNNLPYELAKSKDYEKLSLLREAFAGAECEEVRAFLPMAMLARYDALLKGDYDVFCKVFEQYLNGPDFSYQEKEDGVWYALRLPEKSGDTYFEGRIPKDCGLGRPELEEPLVKRTEVFRASMQHSELFLSGWMTYIRNTEDRDLPFSFAIELSSDHHSETFQADTKDLSIEKAYGPVNRYAFSWSCHIPIASCKPFIGKGKEQIKIYALAQMGDIEVRDAAGRNRREDVFPEWVKRSVIYEDTLFYPIETESGNLAINLFPKGMAGNAGQLTRIRGAIRSMREKKKAGK